MRRSIPVLILILLLFAACSKRPSNVLSEDKMVDLMVDMEIAEAYANQNRSYGHDNVEMGKRVLALHGVSAETLDTTLAWYGRNMDEYSKLFEKIDKELNRRRLKYSDNPIELQASLTSLWPYSTHQVISPLSSSDGLTFSIDKPNINKGNTVDFSFVTANKASGKGVIGVDYSDGSGETTLSNFVNKSRMQMTLQTDTGKLVTRLYGYMLFKEIEKAPIYIDSIAITVAPIDSADYMMKKRNQKSYGAFYNKKKPVKLEPDSIKEVKADSISALSLDSIPAMVKDSLNTRKNNEKETSKEISKPVAKPVGKPEPRKPGLTPKMDNKKI